ncbi:MAG: 23S rRNA (guanosine(2251)-2'-O)-methyltransferase RlmB [Chloroflexi bacterium]|nr:23S rRNA (guanosine(2251)-2'-O)-methyltransferase RlmB [Chloroflexota bacterium]
MDAPEQLAEGEDLVAGRRPVEEAFAARRPARRLLVVPERRAALEALVLHATALRIPVVEVEGGSLTALTGFDGHQGVALVVEPRRWATLDEVLARARERGEPPFVLVLDSLEDPQNVGTLLRSAEACGVHGVVFPTRRSAPIGPAAIKASAGAVEHLLLVPLDDLGGGLAELHGRGLRLVGADESASLSFRDADLRGPLALVVGSEGRGIAGHVRRRLDLAVRIPMRGRVGSLNASVAGSVLLFEAAGQRPMTGDAERAAAALIATEPPLEPETAAAIEDDIPASTPGIEMPEPETPETETLGSAATDAMSSGTLADADAEPAAAATEAADPDPDAADPAAADGVGVGIETAGVGPADADDLLPGEPA